MKPNTLCWIDCGGLQPAAMKYHGMMVTTRRLYREREWHVSPPITYKGQDVVVNEQYLRPIDPLIGRRMLHVPIRKVLQE